MTTTSQHRILAAIATAFTLTVGSLLLPATAQAATVIGGPIDLGTASTYGVLTALSLTNTGPTVVTGDIGISPGTSITGFGGAPNGSNVGAVNNANAPALQAQSDLTTAYNVAASLTPTTSGLAELSGLSLSPGVYSGGALNLANNGILTLAGGSSSIWVFQAASALTIGSATQILISGGASACNVFWQVGSSASIGSSAQFQGTVMAQQSITATAGAAIQGRLLAANAAVTLDSDTISVPTGCGATSTPTTTTSPAITSGAPVGGTVATLYSFAVTASGTPAPTFTVSAGSLPSGLLLDSATGLIAGTSTAGGTSTFTVTATNGSAPDVSAIYSLTISAGTAAAGNGPELAATGIPVLPTLVLAALFLAAGLLMTRLCIGRRPAHRDRHLAVFDCAKFGGAIPAASSRASSPRSC